MENKPDLSTLVLSDGISFYCMVFIIIFNH